jgi:molybdenum cofactor biosynthesis enzyme MoaA
MNINRHSHEHWLASQYVTDVRQSFVADHRHPGCVQCWQREDAGFSSLRTRAMKEFSILPTRPDRPIRTVEIDLGNLCNLRCLMCDEKNSSAILAENVRLGVNSIQQTDIAWQSTGYDNLQKLLDQRPYVVNIRGGEPFYNKDLLSLINNIPAAHAKDMLLHVTTNGTTWSERWQKALAKFRLVRIMFSVDAVGPLYEYMRFPASWQAVEQNIQIMRRLPNVKCLVHAVCQNLNVANLGPLITWCAENDLYLEIESLTTPDYLQMQNLPPAHKAYALTHLDELITTTLSPQIMEAVRSARNVLSGSRYDPTMWQLFKKNIVMRDTIRGNSFEMFIKEASC